MLQKARPSRHRDGLSSFIERCDPEGAVGRRQSGIRRLKAKTTSGPTAAAQTRQTVYWDHLLSTLACILSRTTRAHPTRVRPDGPACARPRHEGRGARTGLPASVTFLAVVMVLLIVVGGCSPVAQSPGANSSTDVAATALTTAGPTVSSATGTDSRQATVKSERPATSSTAPPPPTPEESALGRMSLRQKAAQVLLVSFSGTDWSPPRAAQQTAPPGGCSSLVNVSGAAHLTTLTGALQQRATPVTRAWALSPSTGRWSVRGRE